MQAERSRCLPHGDPAATCGWSTGTSDAREDSDSDGSGEEAESPTEKPSEDHGGLKQQALAALRQVKMGLVQQIEGIAALEAVCTDTRLHLFSALLKSTQEQSGAASDSAVKMEPSTWNQ